MSEKFAEETHQAKEFFQTEQKFERERKNFN